jgi:RHS repeat-associated protein
MTLGYGAADGVRQKFTQKERDNETGLDYFGARYYGSTQGRFTGADPYDINFERQETADPKEADALFAGYIGQPQHWNHYSYALNNPLKYVDPDGLMEYPTILLGKTIKVKISDNLKSPEGKKLKGEALKAAQEKIKANIDGAIAKINSGDAKLTLEQKTAINSMKGIEVRADIPSSQTNPVSRVFNIKQSLSETQDLNWLAASIVHDSFHSDQFRRGMSYNEKSQDSMERVRPTVSLRMLQKR